MFHYPEEYRDQKMRSVKGADGYFIFPPKVGEVMHIIASNGEGWEHVSVHIQTMGGNRTPTWDDMCRVKALFWDENNCVIQYYPAKENYVNCHPNVLHLWRPINQVIPTPPKILV